MAICRRGLAPLLTCDRHELCLRNCRGYTLRPRACALLHLTLRAVFPHVLHVVLVVEIVEGFSTELDLPEPADLLVAEIVGNVASAEGLYATMHDAQQRLLRHPYEASSYIPLIVETLAAPMSYMQHHPAIAPPGFDWGGVRENAPPPKFALLAQPSSSVVSACSPQRVSTCWCVCSSISSCMCRRTCATAVVVVRGTTSFPLPPPPELLLQLSPRSSPAGAQGPQVVCSHIVNGRLA